MLCLLPVALAALGGWGARDGWAQSERQVTEYKVKAAYLYKFASYVQWPVQAMADADAPLVIGLLGADQLGDELALMVTERRADTRPVQVRKLQRSEAASGVHMLFIGRAESAHANEILAATRGKPVLTVSESENAFAAGSMINFVVVDDKVRFDVAPRQGEAGSLKISARLLAVAHRVVGEAL
jgi:hypothetical protein